MFLRILGNDSLILAGEHSARPSLGRVLFSLDEREDHIGKDLVGLV
jgi:hypothetical protein